MPRLPERAILARVLPFAAYIACLALEQNLPEMLGPVLDWRWLYAAKVSLAGGLLVYFWHDYQELRIETRPALKALAIATAIGLFTVKYRVQDLEEKIDRTNQKIVESQQATHILRVEWAHLNESERVELLAGLPEVEAIRFQKADIVRRDLRLTQDQTREIQSIEDRYYNKRSSLRVQVAQANHELADALMADIAHYAGLVAAGLYPSPVGIADFVTSTTHSSPANARMPAAHAKPRVKPASPSWPGMKSLTIVIAVL